jgi:hypothetical protein
VHRSNFLLTAPGRALAAFFHCGKKASAMPSSIYLRRIFGAPWARSLSTRINEV